MKRALRRHHKARMKRRAKRLYERIFRGVDIERYGNKELEHYGDNISVCSCWMCGNPRRFFTGDEKITMQERKENVRSEMGGNTDDYCAYSYQPVADDE